MSIRKMNHEDIAACADILCSVYNNELWQCRWSKETAVEYLTDFFNMQKFVGYVLEEDGAIFGGLFAHEKVWWNNSEVFVEEMFGNDSLRTQIYDAMFNTEPVKKKVDEPAVEWVDNTFAHMPAVAVITMLSKYQTDVRNTEADLLQYFIQQQDAGDFRVNKIQARIIPDSKNVMQGGRYRAEIALMAVDTTKVPTYFIGDNQLDSCIVDIPCTQIGTFPIKGRLEMIDQYGATQTYEFEDQYMVSAPAATVANIDMNVVYKGYDNKMEISVPGIADSQLRVSATGASISKSGNQYICKPSADREITISVSADVDGKIQTIGQKKFRVRPVPSPTAFLRLANNELYNPDLEGVKLRRRDLYSATVVAEYADGNWEGTLTELVPGCGYIYKSVSDKTLQLKLDGQTTTDNEPAKTPSLNLGRVSYEYPNTMNIIARLYQNEQLVYGSLLIHLLECNLSLSNL